MKLEFSRQIFEKCSDTKFHENMSSGTDTLRICNIDCFSTATMVTRTHLTITLICMLPVLLLFQTLVSSLPDTYRTKVDIWRYGEVISDYGTKRTPKLCFVYDRMCV